MMRRIFIATMLLTPALGGCNGGCNKSREATQPDYKHSLKATNPSDRLEAIRERQEKYGVKQ
jgi:hypothetical protein